MIKHVICQPVGACQKYVGTIGLQARFNEWAIKPPHFGTTFELVGLQKKPEEIKQERTPWNNWRCGKLL